MDARSESATARPYYFYIIQSEAGKIIVQYESHALPPEKGSILHLQNITKNYGDVEVVNVEQIIEDHHVVKVTVRSLPEPPI